MLEAFPVEARIDALIAHFDDLNRAHEAVQKAKTQIDQLTPLMADCARHAELLGQREQLLGCREALRPWFAQLKGDLLEKRLELLQAELGRLAGRRERLQQDKRGQVLRRDEITQVIAANGGHRIEQVKAEIVRQQQVREARSRRAQQYDALAAKLLLPGAADEGLFGANLRALEQGQALCMAQRDAFQNRLTESGVTLRELEHHHGELTTELDSLRRRRSNIPSQMLAVRDTLCVALGIDTDNVSFIGELIQVREEERA